MNINVITEIEIDINGGKLGIVGEDGWSPSIVFVVRGCRFHGVDWSQIAKMWIAIPGSEDVVIFECYLRGPLRNPRRLLKSIRSKILRADRRVFEQEMADLDRYVEEDEWEHNNCRP